MLCKNFIIVIPYRKRKVKLSTIITFKLYKRLVLTVPAPKHNRLYLVLCHYSTVSHFIKSLLNLAYPYFVLLFNLCTSEILIIVLHLMSKQLNWGSATYWCQRMEKFKVMNKIDLLREGLKKKSVKKWTRGGIEKYGGGWVSC